MEKYQRGSAQLSYSLKNGKDIEIYSSVIDLNESSSRFTSIYGTFLNETESKSNLIDLMYGTK